MRSGKGYAFRGTPISVGGHSIEDAVQMFLDTKFEMSNGADANDTAKGNGSGLLRFGGYSFEGPYLSAQRIKDQPGIYALVNPIDGQPLDFGESVRLQSDLASDETGLGRRCMREAGALFAVLYLPDIDDATRREITERIAKRCGLPHGGRESTAER